VKLHLYFIAISLLLSACAGTVEPVPGQVPKQAPGTAEADARQVLLFYGTDRNVQGQDKPSRYYGLERGALNYGLASVSLDENGSDANLESVVPTSRAEFLAQLQQAVAAAPSSTAMVFVHGYNHSFNKASRQLAEFAAQTGFNGVSLLWSWPSSRNPAGYLQDEANMRWSHPHMVQFLRDVIQESGAETVHLVAHSMGARGLTDAMLRDVLPGGIDAGKIGEYVLLAPDIDSAIFKRDLAPQLVAAGLQPTLYTSSNDKALTSAYSLRGYSRAGDSSQGPVLVPGVETIDVTYANKSALGHSYFGKSPSVANDLATLLNDRASADNRSGLEYVEEAGAGYWRMTVAKEASSD
jgi:esterase/lipase superfamily enzyme